MSTNKKRSSPTNGSYNNQDPAEFRKETHNNKTTLALSSSRRCLSYIIQTIQSTLYHHIYHRNSSKNRPSLIVTNQERSNNDIHHWCVLSFEQRRFHFDKLPGILRNFYQTWRNVASFLILANLHSSVVSRDYFPFPRERATRNLTR